MNLNNFTIKSQEAVQHAQQIAMGNGQQSIETGHLLKALIETDENIVSFLLKKLNANPQRIEQALDAMIAGYPKVSGGSGQYLSTAANQAITKAQSFLKEFGDEFVAIEHLLLALLHTGDNVASLLKDAGINEKDLKKAIKELRGDAKVTSQSAEAQYNALNKFAKDLNELAQSGKLDP